MSVDRASLRIGPDRRGTCLRITGDRIAATATESPTDGASVEDDVLDASGALVEPGRVNAHTHVYSGLALLGIPAPEPEPENFLQILERLWWRLDRALDRESLEASARLVAAESLLAGTSTLIDHHESPSFLEGSLDILADACQDLGIRAVLCFGATERNGGRDEARRGLEECRRFVESNDRPLVRGLVGLHASFTVSDETIREAAGLCKELDTVLHVHVAEDISDVEDARRRGHDGPLERLLRLDALPPGSILAHGVFLDADQVRRVRDAGCWLVQNPRSNRGNRVGYPPALSASDRVAVGTDGFPSVLSEEIAVLRDEAVRNGEDPAVADVRARGGWRLLAERFDRTFAPLEVDGAADVAVVDEEGVRHLVVAGRAVVRDRTLTTGDLAAIREEAARVAPALWERMRALPAS